MDSQEILLFSLSKGILCLISLFYLINVYFQSDRTARTPTIDETKEVEDCLWVDRYKPQRFTELMGNERVARETMAWVKQWDWCVFGKRGKKRVRDGEENIELEDEYHRPRQRVRF